MNLLKKIAIELWTLYLIVLLSLLLALSSAILVRQELVGSVKFGFLSKSMLFLAEIPKNLKTIIDNLDNPDPYMVEERFPNIVGFQGKPLDREIYLLLSRYDGDLKKAVVDLVDLRSFEVKKNWQPDIDKINALVGNSFPNLKELNSILYTIQHPFLTDDGGLIFHSDYTPQVKIDRDSQLVWQNDDYIFHHSIEQDYDGNLWVPSNLNPYEVNKKYIGSKVYRDDAITKTSINGQVLYQKSVTSLMVENNLDFMLFPAGVSPHGSVVSYDPIHLNDIQPVLSDGPHWKKGDIFLSLRHLSLVLLYRPSTNKILWKGIGHTAAQHDINIIDDHTISIFNNNAIGYFDGDNVDGNSEVVVYDFESDRYSKYFDDVLKEYDVRTMSEGRSKILDNGDLFIEEQNFSRLLFFNNDKSLQWQYVNRANDGAVYQVRWSRILSSPEDIIKVNKILRKGI
jgi:hypothetical protein